MIKMIYIITKKSPQHNFASSPTNANQSETTASIAQLIERPLSEREVVVSNPKGVKNGTSSSLADARI